MASEAMKNAYKARGIQSSRSLGLVKDDIFMLNLKVIEAIEKKEEPLTIWDLLYKHHLEKQPKREKEFSCKLLSHAANHDHYELVKYLLVDKACDVNWTNDKIGVWPLALNLCFKNKGTKEETILLLLEHGANVHKQAVFSIQRIFRWGMAIEGLFMNDDVEGLQKIRSLYKAEDAPTGENLIHVASRRGADNSLEYLLQEAEKSGTKSAEINATDKKGQTPLMSAVKNRASTVEILLKNGASCETGAAMRDTLLHILVHRPKLYEHWENSSEMAKVAQLLVSAGVNVSALDSDGNTALAALLQWMVGFVSDRYSLGAEINPSHLSVACLDTVKILLENDAHFTHKTLRSPVDMVSKSFHSTFRVLLSMSNWSMGDFSKYLLASLEFNSSLLKLLLEKDVGKARKELISDETSLCSAMIASLQEYSGEMICHRNEPWNKPTLETCLNIMETVINYGGQIPDAAVIKFSILDLTRRHPFLHLLWQTKSHGEYTQSLGGVKESYQKRFGASMDSPYTVSCISSPRRLSELARVIIFLRLKPPQKITACLLHTKVSPLCAIANKTHWASVM